MQARTPREARPNDEQLAILRLVARGHTDERISRELGVSKSSVQRRLRGVAAAIGATSRLTLVLCAIEQGWIDLPPGVCGDAEANWSASIEGDQT